MMKFLAAAWLISSAFVAVQASEQVQINSDGFTTFQSETSPNHSIRIKRQNDTICDARSAQYTGWLDVDRKHLFFWYFESRNNPKDDPLTLWLTGGPGGSSMLGMLQELGPCLINEYGNGTVHNTYGWSKESNLLFVDQPAGVGFSYLDKGEPIPSDSFMAAADMHHFLQIFVGQVFPDKAKVPFHISGESYAGHYLPALGSTIVAENALHPHQQQINLKSLLVGNGYVSPLDSAFGYWETLCTTNPGVEEPVFNETRCDLMATNLPRCMRVAKTCYDNPDPAVCAAAGQVCWDGVIHYYDEESEAGGRNRFDITRPCVGDDIFCYPASARLQEYLNLKHVLKALDVPSFIKFRDASEKVGLAFNEGIDVQVSMLKQVQYLLASSIDILIYQGNLDLACNTAGNIKWATNMEWKGQGAFMAKSRSSWYSKASKGKETKAGWFKEVKVRMAEDKLTRFSFVTIDGAGHLVPQDQPEFALDMMTRWLRGDSFEKEAQLIHTDL